VIRPGPERRVWARRGPTDLRKGFAGLAALVQGELGHDLVAGDVFLFISRNRRLLKLLVWDGTGLLLCSKRLARGQFARVWCGGLGGEVELSRAMLRQLLDGTDVTVHSALR
jgi:transposase